MKRHILFLLSFTILCFGCKEEPIGQTPTDTIPPGIVTDVTCESIPGGAIIHYTPPADEDLLYVKAVYELTGNVIAETKASLHTNVLTIEGFGDTNERDVALIAVDRSGNNSDTVKVKVNPLTPPVYSIFETLNVIPDFGGVSVSWNNEFEANISVVLKKIEKDEFVSLETFYSKRKKFSQAYRGMKSKETNFAVYIRDRWDNYSDTLYTTLTPIFEMEVPLDDISVYQTDGDTKTEYGWVLENLWNGSWDEPGWHTEESSGPWPHRFTFAIQSGAVQLSRFKVIHRGGEWYYTHGNPRALELWGSNDPSRDGSDEGWTLMGEYTSYKPSGLPLGEVSNEDIEYIKNGEEFMVDPTLPAFKYFRVKVTQLWLGSKFAHIIALPLWGCPEGYEPGDEEEE